MRRKADPEKERIRQFIREWSGDATVIDTQSFKEVTRAIVINDINEFIKVI